jgi:hypothetical protein
MYSANQITSSAVEIFSTPNIFINQEIATGRWFSPGTPVFSTNKTDRHDISEILLMALNTISP